MKKQENTDYINNSKSYIECPVCNGTGLLTGEFLQPNSFLPSTIIQKTCRSCGGTGIVWG
jgi:DnaJ-class molecular chaperone